MLTKNQLKILNEDLETLLKEDYAYFEKVIFEHLEEINKLNETFLKVKKRLKGNVPEWAWR